MRLCSLAVAGWFLFNVFAKFSWGVELVRCN